MSRARTSRASPSSGLDVVCFGEILWDIYAVDPPRGATRSEAHQGGGRDLRRELGGAPANVATGLARLGVRSGLVAGIGIDKLGDALEQHLVADGVSTRFLVRLPNRTGLTFVTRDAKGEPSFLFYRHDTADVAVRPEHVTADVGRAKWVLVGTSTMMTPGLAAATDRFLSMAEQAKANIVVDLNVREHLWASKAQMRESIAKLVKRAAIVKGSFADLVALTGRRDILWLADNAPNAVWIVTQGAKGASAIGKHGFVARPARKAKCVDATGAGDAFIAGVLAALLEAGATPDRDAWRDERVWSAALDAGHAMGAKAVSRTGSVAGLVGLEEVRSIMKQARRHAEDFEAAAAKRTRGRADGARGRRAREVIDARTRCVAVRSPRGAKTTEIDWGDGHKGVYPHAILRGYCPCAGCQGHSGTIKFVEASGVQLEIEDIQTVGNYALQLTWFDGHGSGLYSYKYLRALCQCDECRPGVTKEERPELPRM